MTQKCKERSCLITKNVKKRHWAFVLYPESAPSNWREIIQETGLQCAISPLHDKDINADGTSKKPHYHVIASYSNTTTYSNVKSLTDSLNCPIPQPLEQVRGYYRYLTHKDNPEKAQYDDKDISTINGFNISNYVELTTTEINAIKKELQVVIRDNKLFEYCALIDYCLDNNLDNAYEVASTHTIFFNTYISSYRNKYKEDLKKISSEKNLT